MEQTRLNFFQQIYYAICKPTRYYRLTKVSNGRLTGFVFLFVLITSLFSIIPIIIDMVGPNGIIQVLREDLPEFEMIDGELWVSETYEGEEAGSYVRVDTGVDKFSYDDIDKSYYQVVLISRTNMIVYQSFGRTQEIDFSDLRGLDFDNSIIDAIIPFVYIILIIVVVLVYLFKVAWYFFLALLASLLGLIVSAISRARLLYATIYKTAVYSLVTVSLLDAILGVLPVFYPPFIKPGISIIITCTYVVYGILSHNTDDAYREAGFERPPVNY